MNHLVPRWLQSAWLIPVLCLAAALPLIGPQIPGLLDMPGHIGRYAIQMDAGQSPDLARWYSYRWALVPNLGADMMAMFFRRYFDFFTAVKISILLIPPIYVAGILILSRVVHGYTTPPALFLVPVGFSYFFHFGFVNFCVGIGLAFLGYALWRWLGDRGRPVVRAVLIVPIACAIWIAHLSGWGLLCILCGCDELIRLRARRQGWVRLGMDCGLRLWPLLVPLLLGILFGPENNSAEYTGHFFDMVEKLAFFAFVLRDRWIAWDIAAASILLSLYIYGVRSRAFACDPALVLATLIVAALYILLPTQLVGSWWADVRLAPPLYSVALLSLRPTREMSRKAMTGMAVAGMLFIGARFAGNAISLSLWDAQFRKDAAAFDAVPRGSTMVTLAVGPCGAELPWNRDRRAHLSGLAIPLRHVFDNGQWATPGGHLIRVHNSDAGPFQTSPSGEWRTRDCGPNEAWYHHLDDIPRTVPYLWIVGIDIARPLPGWTKIRDTGSAQLYRR